MTDREIIDLLLDYYDGLSKGEAKDDKDTLIAIEIAIIDRTSLGLYATERLDLYLIFIDIQAIGLCILPREARYVLSNSLLIQGSQVWIPGQPRKEAINTYVPVHILVFVLVRGDAS